MEDKLRINAAIAERMQQQVEDFCKQQYYFGQHPPSLHNKLILKLAAISNEEYKEQCNKLIDMYVRLELPK